MGNTNTLNPESPAVPATVSSPEVLAWACRLRTVHLSLEVGFQVAVAGSVTALGGVVAGAYVPLWVLSGVLGVLLAYRAVLIVGLRRYLGRSRFGIHRSGRWLVVSPIAADTLNEFDLDAPSAVRGPLLGPGLAFIGWVLLQVVPVAPWRAAVTVSLPDTQRGLAFLVSALLIHSAAAAVLRDRAAQRRFTRNLALLGLGLALVALAQHASGTDRIYWRLKPVQEGLFFGPFWYRNHYAAYMLLGVPIALGQMSYAAHDYRMQLGRRPDLRQRLVHLVRPEGVRLIESAVAPLSTLASLVATMSRGALLALGGGLLLAGCRTGSRRALQVSLVIALFLVLTLSWFGLDRLVDRFRRAPEHSEGRFLAWKASLDLIRERPLTGWGFNTFSVALASHPEVRARLREIHPHLVQAAHNEYLQVAVETGLPGLGLALWAAASALAAVRRDPFRLAAISAVVLHAFVDFDFQAPAIGVLFVVLSTIAAAPEPVARGAPP